MVLLTKCYWGYYNKEDERGRTCGTYWGEEKYTYTVLVGILKERHGLFHCVPLQGLPRHYTD